MKQGRASSSGPSERKIEPRVNNVNVPGVAQLGAKVAHARAVEPLYTDRGASAPLTKSTTRKGGSQGTY